MTTQPYLVRLANRLSAGLAGLGEARRARHRQFVLAHQVPDGGFRGREGDSDLYYTSFALRALSMLGNLDRDRMQAVAGFLGQHTLDRLSIVDLVSWLSSALIVQLSGEPDPLESAPDDWADRVAERLESVRTSDGGYAKTSEGASGSTYHSFLIALCYELLGRKVPHANALVQFVYDRQRDDGGFVEIAPMKRSGTNPTAAAVALVQMFYQADDELRQDVREFLIQVRSTEGGFQANTRIPFADGLSTFTGVLTLRDLGLDGILESRQLERYVTECLELPAGGFRGASWDEQSDVEYTFYGLGNCALLHEQKTEEQAI